MKTKGAQHLACISNWQYNDLWDAETNYVDDIKKYPKKERIECPFFVAIQDFEVPTECHYYC